MEPDLEQQSLRSLIYDYLGIGWRRKLCFLPFPLFVAICVYYVMSLPPIYESEGKILVENQNIPSDLVRTTVTSYASQQMQVIRQQIEATDNVMRVVEKYGLYTDKTGVDPALIAERFRRNMQVGSINADFLDPTQGYQRTVSIAFRVSFRDESPKLAQLVAEELVHLFIEQNTATRTKEATEMVEFLQREADALQQRVVGLEDNIAVFKDENAESLPELLQYNLDVIANAEERLNDNQASIANLTEQEQLLSIELRSMDPYTGSVIGSTQTTGGQSLLTPSAMLAQKKSELAQLRNRYSLSHPTIQNLMNEIENLEAGLEAFAASSSISGDDNALSESEESLLSPAYLQLRYRIGSIQRDIENLTADNAKLRAQVSEYNERVTGSYLVQREIDELERDYEASSEKYEELRAAQFEAEVSQSLEERNQAETLRVLEEPAEPRTPVGPERLQLMVAGIGLSGAICLGLALIFEFMDERVRGSREYVKLLGGALAVVPHLHTAEDAMLLAARKKKIVWVLIFCAGITILLGILLAFLIQP